MHLDELLRRLALNDERAVQWATSSRAAALPGGPGLDAHAAALVQLAALLTLGAPTPSVRAAVEEARYAGLSDEEIVGILPAIGPAVGTAAVVAVAPRLALALDYDIEEVDTAWDGA